MRVHLVEAHIALLCCTHAYAQPCPSTNGTLALTRRSPNDVYSSGGSLLCVGLHRKSADIDGLFERLTDSDSDYFGDDDEDDYVCRVWVLATLPEADRVHLAESMQRI